MMILSANEAASLTKLAMRGVGYSWGIAEESALVLSWLTLQKMPSLQLMSNILQWKDNQADEQIVVDQTASIFSSRSRYTCPLCTGIAVSDFSYYLNEGRSLQLENVVCPLLVLPFLASAAGSLDVGIQIRWAKGDAIITADQLISDMPNETLIDDIGLIERLDKLYISKVAAADFCFTGSVKKNPSGKKIVSGKHNDIVRDVDEELSDGRVCVDADSLRILREYAHRTFAPATEQSRLSGAGAGLSDND